MQKKKQVTKTSGKKQVAKKEVVKTGFKKKKW